MIYREHHRILYGISQSYNFFYGNCKTVYGRWQSSRCNDNKYTR